MHRGASLEYVVSKDTQREKTLYMVWAPLSDYMDVLHSCVLTGASTGDSSLPLGLGSGSRARWGSKRITAIYVFYTAFSKPFSSPFILISSLVIRKSICLLWKERKASQNSASWCGKFDFIGVAWLSYSPPVSRHMFLLFFLSFFEALKMVTWWRQCREGKLDG